jgi:hypothetical protein
MSVRRPREPVPVKRDDPAGLEAIFFWPWDVGTTVCGKAVTVRDGWNGIHHRFVAKTLSSRLHFRLPLVQERRGGYPVLKKWLSYRESKILGRPLRQEEVTHFTTVARRLKALLILGPALDANYLAAAAGRQITSLGP